MAKEKKSKLDEVISRTSSVMGSDYEQFVSDLPVLSTGILSVDLAAGPIDPIHGNGGIRARDLWEVCGKPGNAKSAFCQSTIKTTQARYPGRSVVGLFSEPPDIKRMKREGINTDDLIIVGAYHKDADAKKLQAESALNSLLEFSALEEIKLIIIDSVATLFTSNQAEKTLFDSQPVASLAKVFNTFVNDFTKTTVCAPLLYLNHYRTPIQTGFSFAPPSQTDLDTPGGKTKDFLSMVRILATANPLWKKEGQKAVLHSQTGRRIQEGLDITYQMFRNKYANTDANRPCKASFEFSRCRFNTEEQTLFYAGHFTQRNEEGKLESVLNPQVVQNGAWTYIGEKALNGTTQAIKYLEDNPDILLKLQAQIMPRAGEFFSDEKNFSIEEFLDSDS